MRKATSLSSVFMETSTLPDTTPNSVRKQGALQDGAGEILDGTEGGGDQQEEEKTQPDGAHAQKIKKRSGRVIRFFLVLADWISQRFSAPKEEGEGEQGDETGSERGIAPATGGGNAGHENRSQRPAEIAGQAVN